MKMDVNFQFEFSTAFCGNLLANNFFYIIVE